MKAVWDWHMPRRTADDESAIVTLAHELGFDTLIVPSPTPAMTDIAHQYGLKIVAIIHPSATEAFAREHPNALQQMLPVENAIAAEANHLAWESYTIQAHRWFQFVQMAQRFCFEDPAAQAELKQSVSQALAVADGVAFDGFGFTNYYACFCPRCQTLRQQAKAENPEEHEAALLARLSEASLVDISHMLYHHAKTVKPDALVTNHLWPLFRPNPYYGHRLKLDYCSQTISWFYKPNWSLERVEFEAQEMKRHEEPKNNRFIPFIAMFDEPYLARSGERVAQELAIAQKYGDGHFIFCTLKAIHEFPDVREAVRGALAG